METSDAILILSDKIGSIVDEPKSIDWYITNKDQILEQVNPAFDEYLASIELSEKEGICMYFNNYHMKMPCNMRRETLKDYTDEIKSDDGRTLAELWRDLDTLIDRLEIKEDIEAKCAELDALAEQKQPQVPVRSELFRITLPLYVGMRMLGYTHKDLAG